MFKRSGEKVKSVAKTIFYINIFIAIIICLGGIIISSNMGYGGGTILLFCVVVSAIIVLIAWVSSLFMSAFGDLVNSNERIVELLELGMTSNHSERKNNLTYEKLNETSCYIVVYDDGGSIQNIEIEVPKNFEYEDIEKKVKKDYNINNVLSIQKK